jgi:predicted secreted protein
MCQKVPVEEMIRMTWNIKSLIFVLVLLCVPAAAIVLNSEATVHDGDVSVMSKSTSQATVNQGAIYTISLNEGPSSGYKWTVTSSSGLKLLSDTLSSEGNRKLKFRADQKGEQTVKADYGKSGEENLKHTSEFVLNVV